MVDRTTWMFHNEKFMVLSVNFSLLIIFLWPALTTYVFHALQVRFWSEFGALRTSARNTLISHLIIGFLLFITDVAAIIYMTVKLNSLRPAKKSNEDQLNPAKLLDVAGFDLAHERRTTTAGVFEEDSQLALTSTDKFFAVALTLANLAFTAQLFAMASLGANSGTVTSAILQGVAAIGWTIGSIKFLSASTYYESWLGSVRLMTVLHFTFSYLFFWLSILVVMLKSRYSLTFSSALKLMNSSQTSRIAVLIALFVLLFIVYGAKLFGHLKCMKALDRYASQRLMSRLSMTG